MTSVLASAYLGIEDHDYAQGYFIGKPSPNIS